MTPAIRTLAPDTADYRHDYLLGWEASKRGAEGALERADDRNVSHAWYDGYLDFATGRDKWTWRDARLAGYADVHDYVADQVIIAQADTDHPEGGAA